MLYLLDASVLMTANNQYYPIEVVPEYWEWLCHMGANGHIKIPYEIYDEIKDSGNNKDKSLLFNWAKIKNTKNALMLDEMVDSNLLQLIINDGYATDLNDSELEQIGNDPFLLAYAMTDVQNRCVVTSEVSSPKKIRQNRKVPDVCSDFGIKCCNPFILNKMLGFNTRWKEKIV